MADKISVREALGLIRRHAPLLPSRTVSVGADALGWIAAEAVQAAADTPRFACSAMDGYAVRSADTAGAAPSRPVRLALAGDIPAEARPAALPPGMAAPISTGAPIPEGADSVAIEEICRVADGAIEMFEPALPRRNIREQGEDAARGETILAAGWPLSPEAIGALLAYGVTSVRARPMPRIAILPTGSELASDERDPDGRFDSNGPMIAAHCRALCVPCRLLPPAPDEAGLIEKAFAEGPCAVPADLLISTGGVSAGRHDLVPHILEKIGARIIFHGIAMRPGKPLLFALLPDGRPFFGLPGNPVAALVGFRFFAFAAIRAMMGLAPEAGEPNPLPSHSRPGTSLFLRSVRSLPSGDAIPLGDQRAHVLRSMLDADCWLLVDDDGMEASARRFALHPQFRTADATPSRD